MKCQYAFGLLAFFIVQLISIFEAMSNSYKVFLIGLFCLMSIQVKSQNRFKSPFSYNKSEDSKIGWKYIKGYGVDMKNVVVSPIHWKKKNWIHAGIFTTSVAATFLIDQQVKDWVQGWRSNTTDKITGFIEPYGNGRYTIPFAIGTYLTGLVTKQHRIRRISLHLIENYVLIAGATRTVQYLVNRKRPRDGARYNLFYGPRLKDMQTSFSSGHSALAWMISTTFAYELKEFKWLPPVLYTMSALVSLSRVHDNAHWVTDVIVGSVLGHTISHVVLKRHQINTTKNDVSLLPYLNSNSRGLTLNLKF